MAPAVNQGNEEVVQWCSDLDGLALAVNRAKRSVEGIQVQVKLHDSSK